MLWQEYLEVTALRTPGHYDPAAFVGAAAHLPEETPELAEQVRSPVTRMFQVRDGIVRMNDRVSFPAKPMVGVVGVATGHETLSNGLAGEHGGNLDTRAGDEIAGLMRDVAKKYGRTVVMVTHDPRIAAYADRIVFLKDGKIVDETVLERKNDGNVAVVAQKIKEIGD